MSLRWREPQKVLNMSKKLPRCKACGRSIHPDRYNISRQKFCTKPVCVRERKRKRQREWHARQLEKDPEFREKGNKRCRNANRRRRSAIRAGLKLSGPDTYWAGVSEVIIGLMSQMIDSNDPVRVHASIHQYAARGRRMALSARTAGLPP